MVQQLLGMLAVELAALGIAESCEDGREDDGAGGAAVNAEGRFEGGLRVGDFGVVAAGFEDAQFSNVGGEGGEIEVDVAGAGDGGASYLSAVAGEAIGGEVSFSVWEITNGQACGVVGTFGPAVALECHGVSLFGCGGFGDGFGGADPDFPEVFDVGFAHDGCGHGCVEEDLVTFLGIGGDAEIEVFGDRGCISLGICDVRTRRE